MTRKTCSGCDRPIAVCICSALVHVQAPCEVVILQHPSEQKQPLATVPLLEKCLGNLTVMVGEDFTQHPVAHRFTGQDPSVRVIYPSEGGINWDVSRLIAARPSAERNQSAEVTLDGIQTENSENFTQIKTLIFIDGTWRKAKKIWLLNAWLHSLKTVALDNMPPTRYQIRSSTVEGGASTLEAVVTALNVLAFNQSAESDAAYNHKEFDQLLKPFERMIALQIEKMGEAVFKAHYSSALSE